MNLRTITFWAIYDPRRKEILVTRRFKKDLKIVWLPTGTVVVRMKGHYVPRGGDSR